MITQVCFITICFDQISRFFSQSLVSLLIFQTLVLEKVIIFILDQEILPSFRYHKIGEFFKKKVIYFYFSFKRYLCYVNFNSRGSIAPESNLTLVFSALIYCFKNEFNYKNKRQRITQSISQVYLLYSFNLINVLVLGLMQT